MLADNILYPLLLLPFLGPSSLEEWGDVGEQS